ncbi:VOC family protein [Clostridium sp. D33t1_170424_F3]|uniref:VOC family protein n=1 Tax=Clostridium sp. D33t1_170424_F3 TaxID=2787099 RepID=UPI0018A88A96|nr:VOC family protein [Clostridium sp. D33t1_170424_F3]
MKSTFLHANLNVFDLEKSLAFYQKALGLTECRRKEAPDGSFILVYLSDGTTPFELELTWLRDRTAPYNLGDNEIHLAVRVEDKAAAYALHQEMGYVCFENHDMDLYFINDPDGYWIEILDR